MQKNISEFYAHDHDELDIYFREFRRWKRRNYALAKTSFVKFRSGLLRHIAWEEDILFPLFEKITGMCDGPTAVMREEHRQILAILEAIHDKVRAENPDSDEEEQQLSLILKEHNDKEEMVLYPAIDRTVSAEDRRQVYQQMARFSLEPVAGCGCPSALSD
jgi:hemerythrin-like domain-containing protein